MDTGTENQQEVTSPEEDHQLETAEDPKGNTLLSQLRQRHAALGEERKPLELEIPGYDGMLVAHYKMISWDVAKKIGESTQKSKNPRKELLAQCSLIVYACQEILMRDEDGEYKSFQNLNLEGGIPELGDEPITWASPELDLLLSLDPKCTSSRERVLRTFRNDLAVSGHHQELTEWLQDNRIEDDEDFSER